MNIRYKTHKEINEQKWDKCIENAKNGLVYGTSWFLNNTAHSWDALILDDYSAVLPLVWNRKLRLKNIYHAPFLQKINIFSAKDIDPKIIAAFFEKIPVKFIHVDLFLENSFNLNIPNFKIFKRNTQELYLNKKYDELYSQFSKNHKKNIRKAKKNMIEINTNAGISDVLKLKRIVFKRFRPKTTDLFMSKLTALFKVSEKYTKGSQTYSAYYKEELCAAAYFLKYRNRYIIFSGTTDLGRKTGAAFYLTDTFIKNNAETNTILDFAGSDIKGIAKRNIGFGAKTLQYSHLQRVHPLLKIFKY